jgi:hypothetical protein
MRSLSFVKYFFSAISILHDPLRKIEKIKTTLFRLMITQKSQIKFVICLNNQSYEASLEVGKLYRLIDEEEARTNGLMRVIDESGEDYAFSVQRFYAIELPQKVEEALLVKS